MTSLGLHVKTKIASTANASPIPPETTSDAQEFFFHKGIIGFGDDQRYVMAPFPKPEYAPLKVLIHQQNPLLSFLIVEDAAIGTYPTNDEVSDLYQTFGYKPATTKCYYIVTVQGQGASLRFSINKRAPLLIDHGGRRAGQHILSGQDLPLSCELSDFSTEMQRRIAAQG